MSSLALRVGQSAFVRYMRPKVQTMFSRKYLLFTNTGITLTLGCTGDIMQQRYEILCKRQTHWDPRRTQRILVTNLFVGPTCHYWYLLLDAVLPGRTAMIVMKKILIDQIIFSPINISMFLVVMGWQEGMKTKDILTDLREKGKELLIAEWIIWPPAQMINFFLLPTRFRVLYDNTVSLGFDYYYSYVKYRKGKDPEEEADGSEDAKTGNTEQECDEDL